MPLTLSDLSLLIGKQEFDETGALNERRFRFDNLTPDPFNSIDDNLLERVNFCRDYVSVFTPIRAKSVGSYGLKHDAEKLRRNSYFSNGVMCLGIASLGIPYDVDGPNIFVGMSNPERTWLTDRVNGTTSYRAQKKQPATWGEFADRHGIAH